MQLLQALKIQTELMILFFSDKFDVSSRKIFEWLSLYENKILLVNENGKHFIDLFCLVDWNLKINVNDMVIEADDITSVFFRRSGKKQKLTTF